jgi:DNA-binding IclR family transcriptional regulator
VKPLPVPAAHNHPDYQVRVIDRVIAILNEVAAGPGEKGNVEISKALGLHKSTVHRLLAVLDRNGFVERRPGRSKYGLGWRIFELGMAAGSRLGILERARPYVAQLVEKTGATAHLGVLRRSEVVSLVNVESQYLVKMPATVGRCAPVHCTSLGKAILAFLPARQVEDQLKGYKFAGHTRNTITSKERFISELTLVASRGYAVDNEEFEEGLRCVGAPVWDHSGAVVAAISIAGPSFFVSGARILTLSREVMHVARELSCSLGHRPTVPAMK